MLRANGIGGVAAARLGLKKEFWVNEERFVFEFITKKAVSNKQSSSSSPKIHRREMLRLILGCIQLQRLFLTRNLALVLLDSPKRNEATHLVLILLIVLFD